MRKRALLAIRVGRRGVSRGGFYRRSEADLDLPDLIPFNPEVLGVPKSCAVLQLAFIADEGFITVLKTARVRPLAVTAAAPRPRSIVRRDSLLANVIFVFFIVVHPFDLRYLLILTEFRADSLLTSGIK